MLAPEPFRNVSIKPITPSQADAERVICRSYSGTELGDISIAFDSPSLSEQASGEMFLAEWRGKDVPRGLKLVGEAGIVEMDKGHFKLSDNRIGIYERLIERDGPSHDAHKVIFTITE